MLALPLVSFPSGMLKFTERNPTLSVHIFSKHLQFLGYEEMGAIAADIGFSGIDLTVRPKGHVLPEHVKKDLPEAIRAIEKGGSVCRMITTAIEGVASPVDVEVIKTAAGLGIKYYRTNWFDYQDGLSMEKSLEKYQDQIKGLGDLNKETGIIGCYQNHAGKSVGASFWELKKILEKVDPDYFGLQYDIRHAVVEGGLSWENGLRLLHDHIKTIVIKDFKWEKVNGVWKIINTPLGQGMIDFKRYFALLKLYKINVPVSLHLEYDLGGAEKGSSQITMDKIKIYTYMKKDLAFLQNAWNNA